VLNRVYEVQLIAQINIESLLVRCIGWNFKQK